MRGAVMAALYTAWSRTFPFDLLCSKSAPFKALTNLLQAARHARRVRNVLAEIRSFSPGAVRRPPGARPGVPEVPRAPERRCAASTLPLRGAAGPECGLWHPAREPGDWEGECLERYRGTCSGAEFHSGGREARFLWAGDCQRGAGGD